MVGLEQDRPTEGVGSWRFRRAFLFATVAFCMGTIAWVLAHDMRSKVAETAVTMSFVTLISTVGSYVFGAAWQDVSTIQTTRRPPAYAGYRRREREYDVEPIRPRPVDEEEEGT